MAQWYLGSDDSEAGLEYGFRATNVFPIQTLLRVKPCDWVGPECSFSALGAGIWSDALEVAPAPFQAPFAPYQNLEIFVGKRKDWAKVC